VVNNNNNNNNKDSDMGINTPIVGLQGIDLMFPTRLYRFTVLSSVTNSIIEEIKGQNEVFESSCISIEDRQGQDKDNYCTDYGNNIRIPSLELVMTQLVELFRPLGMEFKLVEYWTARYTKKGFHPLHTHSSFLSDHANLSGVLYLSDLGGTMFYSSSRDSYDNECYSESNTGDLIMFPSSMLHAPPPFSGEGVRYTISFNASLYGIIEKSV